jgi:hypothetical protein
MRYIIMVLKSVNSYIFKMAFVHIENPAYTSNFIMMSQEEKVANEITGFSTIV